MMSSPLHFLGKDYPLIIEPISNPPFLFDGNSFVLSKTHLARTKELVILWYKKQATKILKERTDYFSEKHDLKFKSIKITNAATRWGSCNTLGGLNFSLKLVMAPPPVIDYVVIHELCHTLHHNHSKSFWNEVTKYCPNYKVERNWLKQNGHKLVLQVFPLNS